MVYRRNIAIFFLLAISPFSLAWSQKDAQSEAERLDAAFPSVNVNFPDYLSAFDSNTDARAWKITLCADVPDNNRPHKPAYRQETGHVFFILQKFLHSGDTIQKVFGFYPWRGLPTLFVRKVRSRIKDNSIREYDMAIELELTAVQFDSVLAHIRSLNGVRYHLNNYNCYDYAIEIFNRVAGDHPLPLTHIRFPFPFGRGGSPCSLYADLEKLLKEGGFWSSRIQKGLFRAPVSTGREPLQEK
jgi:hypothetical protein